MYKIYKGEIIRTDNNTLIPKNDELNDYQNYLTWLDAGNVAITEEVEQSPEEEKTKATT